MEKEEGNTTQSIFKKASAPRLDTQSDQFDTYGFFCSLFWMFSYFDWFVRSVHTLSFQVVSTRPNFIFKLDYY